MKTLKHILYFFVAGMFLWSCEQAEIFEPGPDEPDPPTPVEPDPGSADFSNYVAIGNSLTAGVQAGALFDEGQANSMAKILHTQFNLTMDAGDFVQPDINHPVGYTGGMPPGPYFGRYLLQGDPPAPTPQPSDVDAFPNPAVNPGFMYTGATSELNNFGVGGILLVSVLAAETGDWALAGAHPLFNPYYARFASNPGTSTILGDALSAQPSFFSFWLGSNDVLGYAASGGDGSVPITSVGDFQTYYGAAIQTLTMTPGFENLKGVVGNIPPVLYVPYFHLVPWNAIPLDEATANLVNTSYAEYNAGLGAAVALGIIDQAEADYRTIIFEAKEDNAFVLDDESITQDVDISAAFALPPGSVVLPNIRQSTSDDLIPLPAGSVLGTLADPMNPASVYGVGVPMSDTYVLIPSEQLEVSDAITNFNSTIPAVITGLGVNDRVAVANVHDALLSFIVSGGTFQDGVVLAPTLAPPYAAFSEDGVHPNSRGYAFAANVFIDAINSKFSAKVPHASLADYATTALPIP